MENIKCVILFLSLCNIHKIIIIKSFATTVSGTRIRKLVSHPTEHSWIFSSAQGNNEITIWNLETGYRQKVLWGSNSPPLSKTQVSWKNYIIARIKVR